MIRPIGFCLLLLFTFSMFLSADTFAGPKKPKPPNATTTNAGNLTPATLPKHRAPAPQITTNGGGSGGETLSQRGGYKRPQELENATRVKAPSPKQTTVDTSAGHLQDLKSVNLDKAPP